MKHFLLVCVCFFARNVCIADEQDLLSGHPRPSYENVENIDAMAAALRKSLASSERYSFSRSWWKWDRLRCRKPCLVSSIRLRSHHVSVGAWPNAWFPNLPGSGTAQPPACRAQKFSERSTRHRPALTHGTAPRQRPCPRRKVLRSLTRADLGAIRRSGQEGTCSRGGQTGMPGATPR